MIEAPLAVAASVAMHVTWNLMARHQPAAAHPLWWVLLAHLVLVGPWGLVGLAQQVQWSRDLALLLLISALANGVYFLGLGRAYVHAPVALVYPVVRSSPLLIALWSLLLFGEQLPSAVWLGIGVSVAGLLLMATTGGKGGDGLALPWAALAMFATSVYSLSDRAATPHISGFAGLVGFITVGYAVSWLALTLEWRRATGAWIPRQRPSLSVLVIGGLCIGLAYALVIHAMRTLPAAEVVAYTNAGIVLATLASIFAFGERARWKTRLGASAVIVAGLMVMALGRP